MRTANTQSRLGGCPSWSESSLGSHVILLVLSCAGYNVIIYGSSFGIMDTFYSAKRFAAPFWEGVCSKRGVNPFLTEKLHFQKRLVYRKANRKSKQKKKKKKAEIIPNVPEVISTFRITLNCVLLADFVHFPFVETSFTIHGTITYLPEPNEMLLRTELTCYIA